MLTSDYLTELQCAVLQLLTHLQGRGWAVNYQKIQGPGFSVKLLGVVLLSNTR